MCDRDNRLMSPPHRGADRNAICVCVAPSSNGRPLTGARIETSSVRHIPASPVVAPSQGRGSKQLDRRYMEEHWPVAPSQGRGSKPDRAEGGGQHLGRPLTGARREAPQKQKKAGAVAAPAFFKRSLQLHQAAVVGMPFSVKTAWSS